MTTLPQTRDELAELLMDRIARRGFQGSLGRAEDYQHWLDQLMTDAEIPAGPAQPIRCEQLARMHEGVRSEIAFSTAHFSKAQSLKVLQGAIEDVRDRFFPGQSLQVAAEDDEPETKSMAVPDSEWVSREQVAQLCGVTVRAPAFMKLWEELSNQALKNPVPMGETQQIQLQEKPITLLRNTGSGKPGWQVSTADIAPVLAEFDAIRQGLQNRRSQSLTDGKRMDLPRPPEHFLSSLQVAHRLGVSPHGQHFKKCWEALANPSGPSVTHADGTKSFALGDDVVTVGHFRGPGGAAYWYLQDNALPVFEAAFAKGKPSTIKWSPQAPAPSQQERLQQRAAEPATSMGLA